MKELLQGSPGAPEMPTPFGLLAPPLGSLRLKAVEVILTLLEAKDSSIKQGWSPRRSLHSQLTASSFIYSSQAQSLTLKSVTALC